MNCVDCGYKVQLCKCGEENATPASSGIPHGDGPPAGMPIDPCSTLYYDQIQGVLYVKIEGLWLPIGGGSTSTVNVCDGAQTGSFTYGTTRVLYCDGSGLRWATIPAPDTGGGTPTLTCPSELTAAQFGVTEILVCDDGEIKKAILPTPTTGGNGVTEAEIHAAVCNADTNGALVDGDMVLVCTSEGLRKRTFSAASGGGTSLAEICGLVSAAAIKNQACDDYVLATNQGVCNRVLLPTPHNSPGNESEQATVIVEVSQTSAPRALQPQDDVDGVWEVAVASLPNFCINDNMAKVFVETLVRVDNLLPDTANATTTAVIGNGRWGFCRASFNQDSTADYPQLGDATNTNALFFEWPIVDGLISIPYRITNTVANGGALGFARITGFVTGSFRSR